MTEVLKLPKIKAELQVKANMATPCIRDFIARVLIEHGAVVSGLGANWVIPMKVPNLAGLEVHFKPIKLPIKRSKNR